LVKWRYFANCRKPVRATVLGKCFYGIADNDHLTFVSMNKSLFASVRDAVEALA